MIVKGKTEYTKELIKKFVWFNMIKGKGQVITYIIFELVILGLVGSWIYLQMSIGYDEDDVISTVFMCFMPFVMPLFGLFLPILTARLSKRVIGAVNIYEFTEDEIAIESTLPTATGKTIAEYSYVKKIYETKDTFYLYISKRQAYVLRKSDLIQGSITDLQELFQRKYPTKNYIVKGGLKS